MVNLREINCNVLQNRADFTFLLLGNQCANTEIQIFLWLQTNIIKWASGACLNLHICSVKVFKVNETAPADKVKPSETSGVHTSL